MIYLVSSDVKFDDVKTLVLNEIKFSDFNVDLSEFDALVITSKNALGALKFNKILPRESLQIYAIGEASAEAARKFGFAQIYVGKNAHGDEFAREIASLVKNQKTLFLRAQKTASSVGKILRESGCELTEIIAYKNVAKHVNSELKPPKGSVIIFTAPSAVRNYIENFGWDESYKAVAIGKTTALELEKFTKPVISSEQNINSCVTLAKTLL